MASKQISLNCNMPDKPNFLTGNVPTQIEEKLRHAFPEADITLINQSHLHNGHSGDDGSGESHFRLEIRAAQLSGYPRVKQHKLIYNAIGRELFERIHALEILILNRAV
jgi:BolA protein